jgi:HTH-type transcriptional regulator/antitoxin MqsA
VFISPDTLIMNDQFLCSECGKGRLHESTWEGDFRHGESKVHVSGLECHICDQCGADPVFTDQIRRNQLKIADAKRRADKMLTSSDIHALRTRLGLTQKDAATLFGGGTNGFSKYERGDAIQSDPMDRLLKLVGAYPFLLDALRALVGAGDIPSLHAGTGYESYRPVPMNDEAYSSRTLAGQVVVVNMQDYENRRAA